MLGKMNKFIQWRINLSILEKEFKHLLSEKFVDFSLYKNKTFLITGATGLVGSLMIKFLLFLDKELKLDLKVLAVIRNQEKFKHLFGELSKGEHVQTVIADLATDQLKIDEPVDFIIHAAAVTNSKQMINDPVGTINVAVNGTEKILSLAQEKKVQSMVYVSSMEIYGQVDSSEKITEEGLGYVDLTKTRSCYPESKRMCECLCTAHYSQFGLNVKSARLAQTFGVGILKNENRVFAQFAKSAMAGEDIVLHTKGKSEGNYVYTIDAIKGILIILNRGRNGQAYNVSNPESHTTIKEMANVVKNTIGRESTKVKIDIPKNANLGYAPDTKLFLDSKKLRDLGWVPKVGLSESYRRMAQWINEENNNAKNF